WPLASLSNWRASRSNCWRAVRFTGR
ncbi:MAG: hypothetical protein AVDCRST_MAG71-3141, partial [uncultured Lysobacter sp.]